MALAFLQFQDSDEVHNRFQVDIGANKFYFYTIGDGELLHAKGLTLIKNPKYTSPLINYLPESNLGWTVLEVPKKEFDRKNRFIQITSFRTENQDGPAVSDIVEVLATNPPSNDDLPVMSSNEAVVMETPTDYYQPTNPPIVESVSFAYQEQPPVSEAMFLGTLASVVSGVASKLLPTVTKALPHILPAVGSLLGGGSSNGSSVAQTNGAGNGTAILAKLLSDQETIKQLTILLQNKAKKSKSDDSVADILAKLLQQAAQVAQGKSADADSETAGAISLGISQQQGLVDVVRAFTVESGSTWEDANHPLLQTFSAMTNLMLESPKLLSVAASLDSGSDVHYSTRHFSQGLAAPTQVPDFERVDGVRLQFANIRPQMIRGRTKALYRCDQDVAFPLNVDTPRTISRGELHLLVTNATTLEILIEDRYQVENVTSGRLAAVPRLSWRQLSRLKPNEDYIVSVALVWVGKSKTSHAHKRLGINATQLVNFTREYCFDRMGNAGEVIPLNDVEQHRGYWHKVWHGNFTGNMRRITWDCKYYFALEPERNSNARMETVSIVDDQDSTRQSGRMKTGLILSPYELNDLIGQISSYPQLEEAELAALMSSEFKDSFSQVAQNKVQFEGHRGDAVALWVYPEMKLQQVVLKKVEQTDGNGQVMQLSERSVYFPVPSVAHFIGVGA
ncbi:hypothetical protein [Anabaena azotica]|uniref:Uncharacterized protein n=1 Tax=Anabaena azotica FACHB-119 TaxID=947527 RepID=A0ABR8D935_9NOST|nr:hypothetical protein [Anabaena azotica]MBD2503164.1 hypothetical protein [Anabaena azotica FACHB-119]